MIPNAAAAFLIWVAVVALVVIAWSHLRIARALEDLARESVQAAHMTTAPRTPLR